jgi:hypothetical protein
MQRITTQIINPVNVIRVRMRIDDAIQVPYPGVQHLLAEIRAGIDDGDGLACGTKTFDQKRTSPAEILWIGRIAITPITMNARHAW